MQIEILEVKQTLEAAWPMIHEVEGTIDKDQFLQAEEYLFQAEESWDQGNVEQTKELTDQALEIIVSNPSPESQDLQHQACDVLISGWNRLNEVENQQGTSQIWYKIESDLIGLEEAKDNRDFQSVAEYQETLDKYFSQL